MQSYYNFDVEGDAAKIISGSLFRPRPSPTPPWMRASVNLSSLV